MRFDRDTFTEIVDTLAKNKSRSLLTAFGVFWGIFMLVLLLGGGVGLENMMKAQFKGFATNSGFAYSSATSIPYKGFVKGRWWGIDVKDIARIKRNVKGVDVVVGVVGQWNKTVLYGEQKYSDCSLKGLEAAHVYIENQPMKFGRFINDVDNKESRKVCVLGKTVYESLFKKDENPCGKYVLVDGISYQVIGVTLSESDININGPTSESAIIPMSTLQKTYGLGAEIGILAYTAKDGFKISDVEQEVASLLKSAHYIHPDDRQAVGTINAEEMFSMVDNVFIGIGILIWLVGLGTLLAGIIGVSNIMMVTVKERTSEIGIRRAIGARPFDILQQIIAECILLTSLAGMMGLSAGVGVLSLADMFVNTEAGSRFGFGITLSTGIGVMVLLVVLGVVAALAPALRAMAIKPIEAMREE